MYFLRSIKKFNKFLFWVLFLVFFCFWIVVYFNRIKYKNNYFNFAILPHFAIKPQKIDDFYKELKNKFWNIDNIILISPNHFNLGWHWINTWCQNTWILCFNDSCIRPWNIFNIYTWNIKFDCGKNTFSKAWFMNLFVDKSWWIFVTKEHGIWWHFKYLNNYFPNSKKYVFVISPNNKEQSFELQNLINYLEKNDNNQSYLILGSIDFSHHIPERIAYLHDKKTWLDLSYYTWKKSDKVDYYDLDVDCPACLEIIHKSASNLGFFPNLWFRDSAWLYYTWSDNTSRFFILYYPNRVGYNNSLSKIWSWLIFVFLWDTIYDRWVFQRYNTYSKLKQRLIKFYPRTARQHKLLWWLDFVILNLETPLIFDSEKCYIKTWKIRFCSKEILAKVLSEIWIKAVNIANNHVLDNWLSGLYETMKVLDQYWIKYFGDLEKYNIKWLKNIVWTWKIRGQKFVWLWFDLTSKQDFLNNYLHEIKYWAKRWYLVFVSVHWWLEYQDYHNLFQERVARKFIDAGAKIVVGHHPHVIQDIEYYNFKPIVYSLWNFLFDQTFSSKVKKWLLLLWDIWNNTFFITTGVIKTY